MKTWLPGLLLVFASCAGAADEGSYARGEDIVMGRCFLCHGTTGDSSSPLYPKLAGQHPEYIFKQLRNFKRGEREGADMRKVLSDMEEPDLKAVAAYYSKQPATRGNSSYPDMRAAGERLFREGNAATGLKPCKECHGEGGGGTDKTPRLAGQHALYIETQLSLFEERKRTNDNAQMHDVAKRLSIDEMRAVAEYLRGL